MPLDPYSVNLDLKTILWIRNRSYRHHFVYRKSILFPEKFTNCPKLWKIMTHVTLRKIKQCTLALLCKSPKGYFWFFNMSILGMGFGHSDLDRHQNYADPQYCRKNWLSASHFHLISFESQSVKNNILKVHRKEIFYVVKATFRPQGRLRRPKHVTPEMTSVCQCCGSGSGIRCLFVPWFRDG